MVLGPADKDISWIKESYDNLHKLSIEPKPLLSAAAIRAHFEEKGLGAAVASFDNKTGYVNPIGGWADAELAVRLGHKTIQKLGGSIEGGKEVAELVGDGRRVKGVKLVSGEVITADFVVVATGAWCVAPSVRPSLERALIPVPLALPPRRTPSLFHTPELMCSSLLTASGQSVGKWVLTDAERAVHDQMPVIWDFTDGAYVFPPTVGPRETGGGVVKTAIHHRTSTLQPFFLASAKAEC